MNITIVGGDWGDAPKSSGIIAKLGNCFGTPNIFNGGELCDLPTNINSDLVLWMPNIRNCMQKEYPTKKTGAVLICSKVMRDGYTSVDSVSRIFKMHGNAVIEIHRACGHNVHFKLVDALCNTWADTDDIAVLGETIKEFYNFTKSSVRVQTMKGSDVSDIESAAMYGFNTSALGQLITANKKLQDYIMTECGERFFGNVSTRCQKLFPTARVNDAFMYVSPRNTDKSALEPCDMVLYDISKNMYYSDSKPSVDSPIQASLYKKFPKVNFMIHGHAHIDSPISLDTTHYRLCGDLREFDEISSIASGGTELVNLKRHGFLIMAETIEDLNAIINHIIEYAEITVGGNPGMVTYSDICDDAGMPQYDVQPRSAYVKVFPVKNGYQEAEAYAKANNLELVVSSEEYLATVSDNKLTHYAFTFISA